MNKTGLDRENKAVILYWKILKEIKHKESEEQQLLCENIGELNTVVLASFKLKDTNRSCNLSVLLPHVSRFPIISLWPHNKYDDRMNTVSGLP